MKPESGNAGKVFEVGLHMVFRRAQLRALNLVAPVDMIGELPSVPAHASMKHAEGNPKASPSTFQEGRYLDVRNPHRVYHSHQFSGAAVRAAYCHREAPLVRVSTLPDSSGSDTTSPALLTRPGVACAVP